MAKNAARQIPVGFSFYLDAGGKSAYSSYEESWYPFIQQTFDYTTCTTSTPPNSPADSSRPDFFSVSETRRKLLFLKPRPIDLTPCRWSTGVGVPGMAHKVAQMVLLTSNLWHLAGKLLPTTTVQPLSPFSSLTTAALIGIAPKPATSTMSRRYMTTII